MDVRLLSLSEKRVFPINFSDVVFEFVDLLCAVLGGCGFMRLFLIE